MGPVSSVRETDPVFEGQMLEPVPVPSGSAGD